MSDNPSTVVPDDKRQGGLPSWAVKTIAIAVVVVLAVIAYFILAAFLPRWWSQKIGSAVGQSISTGSFYGIAFGAAADAAGLDVWQAMTLSADRLSASSKRASSNSCLPSNWR